MSNILGVKFRPHGQVYFFESGPFVVGMGDRVIVKTDQGMGLGDVVAVRDEAAPGDSELEFKPIYRLATDEDMAAMAENEVRAREAYHFCRECIERRELEMKLVDVEIFFDRSKMIFYFTAPGRIDFRELVKDLVRTYRTRIELRQIGVRHETQMVGAVGNCGQVACCRRFLRKFVPVTIKMAKEQNLFLNPTKISGICGRLLCCLSYEEANYREFYRRCPKIGKRMATDRGMVKVIRANFFRGTLSVITDTNEEVELTLDEWEAVNPRRPDQHQLQHLSQQHDPQSQGGGPRRERPSKAGPARSGSSRPGAPKSGHPQEPGRGQDKPQPAGGEPAAGSDAQADQAGQAADAADGAPKPAEDGGKGRAPRKGRSARGGGERTPKAAGTAPDGAKKKRPRRGRKRKPGPKPRKQ